MREVSLRRYRGAEVKVCDDVVAVEEPLQITVDGFPVAVVMRTPGADEDLVRGFLLTEGIVKRRAEVARIDLEGRVNHALVFLTEGVVMDRGKLTRHLYSASSCGICGKASIEAVRGTYAPLEGVRVMREVLLDLPEKLRAAQESFGHTGGLHGVGLFDLAGNLLVVREDVGRHNAIDKVVGAREGGGEILMVSGRVSFEVMQKALAARIPVVAAISAPTSLAIEFAKESGQTLVGFLRPPGFNVYAGEVGG